MRRKSFSLQYTTLYIYIMLTNKCVRNDGFRKSPFDIIVENLTRLLDKEQNFQRQLIMER